MGSSSRNSRALSFRHAAFHVVLMLLLYLVALAQHPFDKVLNRSIIIPLASGYTVFCSLTSSLFIAYTGDIVPTLYTVSLQYMAIVLEFVGFIFNIISTVIIFNTYGPLYYAANSSGKHPGPKCMVDIRAQVEITCPIIILLEIIALLVLIGYVKETEISLNKTNLSKMSQVLADSGLDEHRQYSV
ncbi:hypothetical protein DASC09_018000 [Saccharomycopsis crataegensis]|uniref:MARVEL domain-containing protein n=1 Tax=Saccharomycopsis crataegensis TaxID=43959 RepID=A0AAV5QJC9_9ASCO|nr:hypothetical protein DASC09_018000 [Saccharomycopsis crataegensis]